MKDLVETIVSLLAGALVGIVVLAVGVALTMSYNKITSVAHKRTEFTVACDAAGGEVARMGDNNEITAFCIKDGLIEGVLQ